jgi:hypothetical protein
MHVQVTHTAPKLRESPDVKDVSEYEASVYPIYHSKGQLFDLAAARDLEPKQVACTYRAQETFRT